MRQIQPFPFLATGLFLLLTVVLSIGCGDGNLMGTAASLQDLEVADEPRVHVIRPRFANNAAKTVVFYGKFRPVQESRRQFQRPGIVSTLSKTVGDSVVAGELIAELNQDQLADQASEVQAKLTKARKSIATASADAVAKTNSEIQRLTGQLAELKGQLEVGKLTADIAGTIVKCNFDVGDTATPGQSYFVIADMQSPEVVLNLDAASAAELDDNQSIWIGHKTPLQTSIKKRLASSTESGAEQIILEFKKPLDADSWSYGTVVEVRYRTVQDQTGYWIPMTALNRSASGDWSVLIAEPVSDQALVAVLRRQLCQIVWQQNDQVLVTTSSGGDGTMRSATPASLENSAVVLDGSHRVVAGQTVFPIELLADDSGTLRPNDDR